MHQLPTFKGAACQKGYGIGSAFIGLTRAFALVVNKGLRPVVFESGVQILDDVSRGG